MFTALDRESKVGGIPDLLAVVDVLRGCGVIAFGELNIDGPDLAVAVRSYGDIGVISVEGSGSTRSVGYLDLLGSAVDGDCDRISRGIDLGNADSRCRLSADNYVDCKAFAPCISSILRSDNIVACGKVEVNSPDLISEVGAVCIDLIALCVIRLDGDSRIKSCKGGGSAVCIDELDLTSLIGDLNAIVLLAAVVRGVVGNFGNIADLRLGLLIERDCEAIAIALRIPSPSSHKQ